MSDQNENQRARLAGIQPGGSFATATVTRYIPAVTPSGPQLTLDFGALTTALVDFIGLGHSGDLYYLTLGSHDFQALNAADSLTITFKTGDANGFTAGSAPAVTLVIGSFTAADVASNFIFAMADALSATGLTINSGASPVLVLTGPTGNSHWLSVTDTGSPLSGVFNAGPFYGADAVTASGTQLATLVPEVSGMVPCLRNVTASILGDTAWTGDVLIAGKNGDSLIPLYRIVQPAAVNPASTGRNYGMVVVPSAWGAGQTIEPDRYGSGGQPADLTQQLPAGWSIVVLTTGTTLGTTQGGETTGSDCIVAGDFFYR